MHVMLPTSGIGATTALRGVGSLLKAVTEEGITAESLAKFEKQMRVYAKEAISMSHGREEVLSLAAYR